MIILIRLKIHGTTWRTSTRVDINNLKIRKKKYFIKNPSYRVIKKKSKYIELSLVPRYIVYIYIYIYYNYTFKSVVTVENKILYKNDSLVFADFINYVNIRYNLYSSAYSKLYVIYPLSFKLVSYAEFMDIL